MMDKSHWDDEFLNNLKKGFESLSKNDYACVIMEADSSLIWVLVRNKIFEPYHLILKLTYRDWKDILQTASRFSATHRSTYGQRCEYTSVPVGNVQIKHGDKTWLFSGTFAYFLKALQAADSNILKLTSIVQS